MSRQLNAEQYIAIGGIRCPFCLSEDIQGHSVELDAGTAFQPVGCNECDRDWTDTYQLTGYEERD